MPASTITYDDSLINSRLSFRPLIKALKKNIGDGNPGIKKLYGGVVAEFESHAELMQPIGDLEVLKPYGELIEELLASIFPPTSSPHENIYAIAFPFKFEMVYTSRLFHHLFIKAGSNELNLADTATSESLNRERMQFAYELILKKYCGYSVPESSGWVHCYKDPHSGLIRYLELKVDARFIEVSPIGELPKLPEVLCPTSRRLRTIEELISEVPLERFLFEGIAIVKVNDVTHHEVIVQIKNKLLNNAISDATVYPELEAHIQTLIGLKDIKIGITPFFRINGHYVYSEIHNTNSLLFKHFHSLVDKDEVSDCCKIVFRESNLPVVYETLNEDTLGIADYLQYFYMDGARSLILCPLKHDNELIGILEIVSETPGRLKHYHPYRIEDAIPLFTLALKKSLEHMQSQIDAIIKEQFTAVQPAVEWKFTEVALNYIVNRRGNEDVKIERIAFHDVYPLYGAIDIRNSSTERSHAIQLDLVEQLELARKVIRKAQAEMPFPLLQEIEYKIDKYISSASAVLLSDDEVSIHDFMQGQVRSIFNHLQHTQPSVRNEVEHYFSSLDPQIGMLYHHRKEYEQSISRINDALARFIDKEQASAQLLYPHYFERYVTDGVEFNIYIGQSIAPKRKFDEIYLRNMKMWQLTVLARAAQLTREMETRLPHPLRTTQLILAHSQPLSITFRTEERKFDVDGAYNIRYEIIKKRIDKVRIRDTNERLTQPGKIAIVYSQLKDADEYCEYIEFLQNLKLIKPGIERYDLEELQGVVGLKALRVDVNLDSENTSTRVALSDTTSQELIGD
ncbi:MAG TPA: hypothetical protein VEB63_10770 [Chitinophagaceae bacterium]|nr:hypothetical protein [Chitinophagaceae bacterium]